MSAIRSRFCQLALSKLGSTVLWAQQGPDVFDCSGFVMWLLDACGARMPDHNAQMLSDETPNLATAPGSSPLPGDLAFYGTGPSNIIHVGIWLEGGKVLSADGATRRVLDLAAAKANTAARVRLHESPLFRKDYQSTHRNRFLDDLEKVTR